MLINYGLTSPERMVVEALTILISTSLFLYILVSLIRFLYRVWWNPILIQKQLATQGIRGPSYKFLYGNIKEVLKIRNITMKSPMDLTHDILPRVLPHVHLWLKSYGKNFLSWDGYKAQLFITEPDLIKEVLNNRNGVYVKGKPKEYLKKLLGDGLVIAEGKKWSKQRKLANHAFRHGSGAPLHPYLGMVPTMIASVENMLERWAIHGSKEIEVLEEFRVLTSDVISKTAFGSNYKDGQKIFDMLMKLTSIITANALKIKIPVIGCVTRYGNCCNFQLRARFCNPLLVLDS